MHSLYKNLENRQIEVTEFSPRKLKVGIPAYHKAKGKYVYVVCSCAQILGEKRPLREVLDLYHKYYTSVVDVPFKNPNKYPGGITNLYFRPTLELIEEVIGYKDEVYNRVEEPNSKDAAISIVMNTIVNGGQVIYSEGKYFSDFPRSNVKQLVPFRLTKVLEVLEGDEATFKRGFSLESSEKPKSNPK